MHTDLPNVFRHCIKTNLEEETSAALFSRHFLLEVLPERREYKNFKHEKFIDFIDEYGLLQQIKRGRKQKLNESQTEDIIIAPVLKALGNGMMPQAALNSDHADFFLYPPKAKEGFLDDYSNTYSIVESKRINRLRNKYFIQKQDNSDEIYQTLRYLRTLNLQLDNNGLNNDVNFAILTDGVLWRVYSKKFTHSTNEFSHNFIEFNLEHILEIENVELRSRLLKLFGFFFNGKTLRADLAKAQSQARELQIGVTKALREQTFTALEYIATGIWRSAYVDQDLVMRLLIEKDGRVNFSKVHKDENERARLLKLIFDESVVYLLRLLFLLYGEDRDLFEPHSIPKVIKGDGNLLSKILGHTKSIGEVSSLPDLQNNDDVRVSQVFAALNKQYNGGLFSDEQHPIIANLDIDDELFVAAIDNLCRVEVKKKTYSVDFSTIPLQALGSIYEGLLDYELTIATEDLAEMPSAVNNKRLRYGVKKNDLYLVDQDGERKASGSYYTPDLIVDHLVDNALGPKLEALKEKHGDDFESLLAAVQTLKIVDPSMGSGHMLVSAFNKIMEFLHKQAEAHQALDENPTSVEWSAKRASEVRSSVVRNCIHGVDLNPVAVELAKLVLWMQLFQPDKPFEFFDYNLQCGNSLIGVEKQESSSLTTFSDDASMAAPLFRSQEDMIADTQELLLAYVRAMFTMPRSTVEEVHLVEEYWNSKVVPLQRQLGFFSNVSLSRWLAPEVADTVEKISLAFVEEFTTDYSIVDRIANNDPTVDERFKSLAAVNSLITERHNPFHWHIRFPDIAVRGGFDVVLSNPPWDKIKPNRNEFFPKYIPGYDKIPTAAQAKAVSEALIKENSVVSNAWDEYSSAIENSNSFFADFYKHQVVEDKNGKKLKGDANLYKVFLERIYGILAPHGSCGIVVPDNFNIDRGTTGLRRLILGRTSLREIIMFENRKRLFQIHGQYKFNVMTFDKSIPRSNALFDAGFYWYEPAWLDGTPDKDFEKSNKYNSKKFHKQYRYPMNAIRKFDPDLLTIFEFRDARSIKVFERMQGFPIIGDPKQAWSIRTYREFDMTNDSDLFNSDGEGWPLFQGGSIHYFNSNYSVCEKSVVQTEGEARLAKKWRISDIRSLPTRTYRAAWRTIAQPTDTRSLITTVIPRGSFTGNSLGLIEVQYSDAVEIDNNVLVAGVNALLSSMVADFYIRLRIAKNVNAFILKSLPAPRDLRLVERLGHLALPLHAEDEFEKLREINGTVVPPLINEEERLKRMAKIDAISAEGYGLAIEEYQSVLGSFPLVNEAFKARCLLEFKELSFDK